MQYKLHKVYLQIKLFIRVIIELPSLTRVSQSWLTPAVMVENRGQNDDSFIYFFKNPLKECMPEVLNIVDSTYTLVDLLSST